VSGCRCRCIWNRSRSEDQPAMPLLKEPGVTSQLELALLFQFQLDQFGFCVAVIILPRWRLRTERSLGWWFLLLALGRAAGCPPPPPHLYLRSAAITRPSQPHASRTAGWGRAAGARAGAGRAMAAFQKSTRALAPRGLLLSAYVFLCLVYK
jgi:hypothetical protein